MFGLFLADTCSIWKELSRIINFSLFIRGFESANIFKKISPLASVLTVKFFGCLLRDRTFWSIILSVSLFPCYLILHIHWAVSVAHESIPLNWKVDIEFGRCNSHFKVLGVTIGCVYAAENTAKWSRLCQIMLSVPSYPTNISSITPFPTYITFILHSQFVWRSSWEVSSGW